MKRSSTGIGSTQRSESAQSNSGELSPTQRGILSALRNDGPGTEAEIYQGLSSRKPEGMGALRDDLAELERRMLVECKPSKSGVRFWYPVGRVA